MSLFPLRLWRARHREESPELPAPGPFPAAQSPRGAIAIFVVIVVVVAWLLVRGYSADTALGAVAGAGVLAAAIASRLTGSQTAGS